ncbi:hypothetical protein ACA29_22965 [Lederbergia galactosidilytica]|uniref:Uncharacterized protein n=1 Tax=Lederbergia galactosidilytica TaxID=217031 RepID=A0A0Q9XMR3_9BACI|nr:hypothetical protein ACA29_22965 [Lederbergia galactosidilytica]
MNIVFVGFIESRNIGDLLIADILEEKLMVESDVKKYSFNLIPEREIKKIGGGEGLLQKTN